MIAFNKFAFQSELLRKTLVNLANKGIQESEGDLQNEWRILHEENTHGSGNAWKISMMRFFVLSWDFLAWVSLFMLKRYTIKFIAFSGTSTIDCWNFHNSCFFVHSLTQNVTN